jgi:di/tricarboxylate transporter
VLYEQLIVFAVILGALALFIQGRWRHDVVALLALLALALTGILEPARVFSGFGHAAVITVAAVLVISYALINSGLVDVLAGWLARLGGNIVVQLVVLTAVVMLLSAFMNNIGALAIMMPVAIQLARRHGTSPSVLLMPLAFASLLGGLITAIGTPPNIIIATFREEVKGAPFTMFDFAPVGLGVALASLVFIWLGGWRLIPRREPHGTREELFEIKGYFTELMVPEGSPWVGRYAYQLEQAVEADVVVGGIARGKQVLPASSLYLGLRVGDLVLVEADAKALKELMDATKLELAADQELAANFLVSEEMGVVEAIVTSDSLLVNRTAGELDLRRRYGINLLAVSREGHRIPERLHRVRFQPGDVLLLQGDEQRLSEILTRLRCLPLAQRGLRIGSPRRTLLATGIFATAIAATALGFVSIALAFVCAAVAMVMTRLVRAREVYSGIDWSIIVLLGALIPVGEALETTGAAQLIADLMLAQEAWMSPIVALVLLIFITMRLSDVINNAAAAVLMAPIAVGLAHGMGIAADPFLMTVAVGASGTFLTPIGHQSNLLVMGPGGYRFGDYWWLGLPVSIVYMVAAIILIPIVWPFTAT